jgi:serine/threonine-protein kinase
MKILLVTLLLALTTLSYSQTIQDIEFVNKIYQIKYPKNWQLDSSKTMGTDLLLFAPLENESDKFRENVNIIIQNLAGQNIDLEKYKLITDKQLENAALDAKVSESEIVKAGNESFYRTTYAMTQGKLKLKISSKCFIKNDKAFLVTFTSEIEKYDSYKKIGEEILNTFRLRK